MEQPTITQPARRTRKQIQQLLAEFSASDVSVKEFCAARAIKAACFRKWQTRYKDRATRKTRQPGFAEVKIIPTSMEALFAEVKGIRIYQPVAASYLKELNK